MYDIRNMIDNALKFGDTYSEDRAPSEHIQLRATNDSSEIEKLASALSFIADNLDDLEPSAEEKLAEAELLMSYYNDEQQAINEEQIKMAQIDAERQFAQPSARDRLANILGR
jgi:hypothetical protein